MSFSHISPNHLNHFVQTLSLLPILFIAPRGLITILLFVALIPEPTGSIVTKALVIQVIVISALVMMFGLMLTPNNLQAEKEA